MVEEENMMSFKAVVTAMLTSIFKTNFGTNSNAETFSDGVGAFVEDPDVIPRLFRAFLSLAHEYAALDRTGIAKMSLQLGCH